MTERNLGRKGLFHLKFHVTIHCARKSDQNLKVGFWKQELKQRPWKHTAYLDCSSWLRQFAYSTQNYEPSMSLAFTYHPSIKKMYHWCTHRPIWWGYFSNEWPLPKSLWLGSSWHTTQWSKDKGRNWEPSSLKDWLLPAKPQKTMSWCVSFRAAPLSWCWMVYL